MAHSSKKLKRPRYCPELAKSVAKRKREKSVLRTELEETVVKTNRMRALLLSDDVLSLELSDAAIELLLITELGLKGAVCLQQALSVVPNNFPDRLSHVFSIVREELTGMTEAKCSRCMQLLERLDVVSGTAQGDSSAARNSTQYHRFLSPPVLTCANTDCPVYGSNGSLVKNHNPITVVVYTLSGPEVALKQTMKCKGCSFIYNYSTYGRKTTEGERYYTTDRNLIEVSYITYCERHLYEFFCSLSLHCWVSFIGFAEAYYDYCRSIPKQSVFDQWWQHKQGKKPQLSRKTVSDMFYTGEIEKEIRDTKHPDRMEWQFQRNSDQQKYMGVVVTEQSKHLYSHSQTPSCPEVGCGRCWSMDGNWKLCFPHCMFPVTSSVPYMPKVRFPNVCPEKLKPKSAFCVEHYPKAQAMGYPTDVKGFLKYCGTSRETGMLLETAGLVVDEEIQSDEEEAVAGDEPLDSDEEEVLGAERGTESDDVEALAFHQLPDTGHSDIASGSDPVLSSQGTSDFIKQFPSAVELLVPSAQEPTCRKDLGEKRKLRLWSRGHVFLVRPCGHIDFWKPIYRSESPSQVLLIVVAWLYKALQNIPESEWSSVVLSYDNMSPRHSPCCSNPSPSSTTV